MRVFQKSTIGSGSESTTSILYVDPIAFSIQRKGVTTTDWFDIYPSIYALPSGSNVVIDIHYTTPEGEEDFERHNIDFFDVHSLTDSVTFHRCGAVRSDSIKLSDVLSLYLWEETDNA